MLNAKELNVSDTFDASHYPSEAEPERGRLADALSELYNLLEEYAPSWYTREHHDKAESALQALKKS